MNPTKEIADFLHRFQEKRNSVILYKIREDQAALSSFFPAVESLDRLRQLAKEKIANDYNIFEILNISHYETKVHTPFLCNLLSPNGSHAQGDLFIRSFIEHFKIFPEKDLNKIDFTQLFLAEEWSTIGYGRIDIFIESTDIKNPFIIVIENKIYASDQEKQLERYYEYATNKQGEKKPLKILYLKPWKGTPKKIEKSDDYISISKKLFDELIENKTMECIGYHEHIIPWLEKILPKIKASSIQELIRQYLMTINQL